MGLFLYVTFPKGVKLFSIFDYRDERAFAKELATMISGQLTPESLAGDGPGNLSVNKITRLLERVYREVGKHFQGKKMGVVRRSVFANAFKWSLREKGYPANFIDVATEGLVMEMTKVK